MPFEKVDISKTITETLAADPELNQMWNESRMEYNVLGELVKLRKEQGISQALLAEKSGSKQQIISRIEKHENSPTLKTLCGILDVLGYEIQFVPRQRIKDLWCKIMFVGLFWKFPEYAQEEFFESFEWFGIQGCTSESLLLANNNSNGAGFAP